VAGIKGKGYYKHGGKHTRIYTIWCNIIQRCNNPNYTQYEHYGGRGIRMCDEWRNSFEVFRDWAMSNGYADNLTIDRIDNNGNYEPSNCRFVCMITQARNKRVKKNSTSGVRGVTWDSSNKKWVARIKTNGKMKYLGGFSSIPEAKKCRQEAEAMLWN